MNTIKTLHSETVGNVLVALIYCGCYAVTVDGVQVLTTDDQSAAWNEYDRQVWQNAGEQNS